MTGLESPLIRGYRELLRVGRDATADEIRQSYRQLAKIYHPDVNSAPEAAAVFARINDAYEALLDKSRLKQINLDYTEGRYAEPCVAGLPFHVGSFFGHRFAGQTDGRTQDPEDFPWWEARPPLHIDERGNSYYEKHTESHISILDDPSLDLVEVIFAGSLRIDDEITLYKAFRAHEFAELPWFVLNNEGIVHFLNRDIEGALRCYEELNKRIPNNIVFLYRLGLCHQLAAFMHMQPSFLRGLQPERRHVREAVRCYREAISLGENRLHMPQRCLTIRKTLADLLAASGRNWLSYNEWNKIKLLAPECLEAESKRALTKPGVVALLEDRTERRRG